jgi:membrane-bound serine protease (ClpP class)
MSTIAAILAIIFLDPPWKWVVAGVLLVTDVFEIFIWLRWRKRRSITGSETLVDLHGEAIEPLDPEGQVKLRGQIWKARSSETVARGDWVKVDAIEGLTLLVSKSNGPYGAKAS